MGKESAAKAIRKQLRQVVKEMLPDMLVSSLVFESTRQVMERVGALEKHIIQTVDTKLGNVTKIIEQKTEAGE